MKFIQELNKLYEKYYGNKREYKIPSHLIDKSETNKTNYAHLLMELNKRCSKWINKHVEESPVVYLTPIFIDYFNYLIQLEKEFFPATNLFTKPEATTTTTAAAIENGSHKSTNVSSTSSLFNGGSSSTVFAAKPPTINSEVNVTTPIVTLASLKPVEEISTAIKFPAPVADFKFAPIPLTTSEVKSIAPTVSSIKSDFFGSNSASTTSVASTFKFGASDTTLQTLTTPNKSPVSASIASNIPTKNMFQASSTSFFNKSSPILIENKKVEDKKASDTPPVSFSFGNNSNNTNKEISFKSTTTTTTTATPSSSLFSFTTSQTTNPTTNLFSFSTNKPVGEAPTATNSTFKQFSFSTNQQETTTTSNLFSSQNQTTQPASTGGGLFSKLTQQSDSSKPFSFGNLAPASSLFGGAASGGFGFATQSAKPVESGDGEEGGGDEEAYEPPKPDVKEVVEEGALYSKRIKLYYFNNETNQYADRGIGNLHIKLTSDGSKKQMIIRADTSLGMYIKHS